MSDDADISLSMTFTCPRCGGPYFGTVLTAIPSRRLRCDCDVDGGGTSETWEQMLARYRLGKKPKPLCGWRGTWEEVQKAQEAIK